MLSRLEKQTHKTSMTWYILHEKITSQSFLLFFLLKFANLKQFLTYESPPTTTKNET